MRQMPASLVLAGDIHVQRSSSGWHRPENSEGIEEAQTRASVILENQQ
jgi:hypothetical protein